MADHLVSAIGALAAILSTTSFTPQLWKIIKTGDVKGLSWKMYLLTAAAFTLWSSYGVLKGDWTLIVPNVLCLLMTSAILVMIKVPAARRAGLDKIVDQSTA